MTAQKAKAFKDGLGSYFLAARCFPLECTNYIGVAKARTICAEFKLFLLCGYTLVFRGAQAPYVFLVLSAGY